ncbi:hypothetical protein N7478_002151 [Penicillium angulare]|uniref:uncharacterized protein n=1 Tax=Penicillium angulare TaxID=116970 RepID=UPI0025404406|nr:uncharacterized protein N7478_002151 [Penicillium angulare]KAJ5289121.1 hypothetical protein N7478_002151 [Penicillium angulare]
MLLRAESSGSSNPAQLPLQVKEREQGLGSDRAAYPVNERGSACNGRWGREGKEGGGDECKIEEWKERKERDKRSKGQGEVFIPAQQESLQNIVLGR